MLHDTDHDTGMDVFYWRHYGNILERSPIRFKIQSYSLLISVHCYLENTKC